jgi:hypothetical protein
MIAISVPSRFLGVLLVTALLSLVWSRTLTAGGAKKVPLPEQFKTLADRHCAWLVANKKEVEKREAEYEKAMKSLARVHRLDQGLTESLYFGGNYETYQIPVELAVALAKHRLGTWEDFPLPSNCLRTETKKIKGIWELRLFMRRAVEREKKNWGITMAFGYDDEPTAELRAYMERFDATDHKTAQQFVVSGAENLVPLLEGLGKAKLLK